MHSLDTKGLITFCLPTRGGNGQYSNDSLVYSTVRPEITHVTRVTNPKDIKDPRSTWWCLADAGIAIGSSRSGSLLGLLHRRERDSRIFTNAEIIFDDFGSKDTLLLNNRGQTFVSLSGFLEILSKTELSSDKIDDFQEEIFGRVLPQLAFEGRDRYPNFK